MDRRHNTRHSPSPPKVHHTSHTGPEKPHAPPVYTVNDHHPPSPQVQHTSHTGPGPVSHHSPSPAPPHVPSYSPPPPAAAAPHQQPHAPAASTHSTTHHKENEFANKPSVRVFCKAENNFSLTIRDGKVVLAPSSSADPLQVGFDWIIKFFKFTYNCTFLLMVNWIEFMKNGLGWVIWFFKFQHWIKDEKYSTRVKDKEGFPSFALINKATGQAIKHSVGATQPVILSLSLSKKSVSWVWIEVAVMCWWLWS